MEETKENKKVKRGKHKEKPTIGVGFSLCFPTIGDMIFRVLIILAIFCSVLIAYILYLQGIVR